MPAFCQGVPRWLVLSAVAGLLALLPSEALAHGPVFCLWRNLFHLPACPACGTTRALGAFLHGDFSGAVAFNPNVMVTGPLLLALLLLDTGRMLKRISQTRAKTLRSLRETTGEFKPE
ncbi:MAG: DUF2752 domain-containing protein [Terriglobia bacterium]